LPTTSINSPNKNTAAPKNSSWSFYATKPRQKPNPPGLAWQVQGDPIWARTPRNCCLKPWNTGNDHQTHPDRHGRSDCVTRHQRKSSPSRAILLGTTLAPARDPACLPKSIIWSVNTWALMSPEPFLLAWNMATSSCWVLIQPILPEPTRSWPVTQMCHLALPMPA
jgi:hypothetical protein